MSQGHWLVVWLGVIALFTSGLYFDYLLLPAAFFGGCLYAAQQVAPRAAKIFQILSLAWITLIFSLWAGIMYEFASRLFIQESLIVKIGLVWALSATLVPWALYSHEKKENVFFTGTLLIFTIACIALSLAEWYWSVNYIWYRVGIIAGIMGLLFALQSLYDEYVMKDKIAAPTTNTITIEAEEGEDE